MAHQTFTVGDVIRMPHYDTAGGPHRKRVWKVVGQHLGATWQEGTYALRPLDYLHNEAIHVPCVMLETHPKIERV
jgi:hypothetical protein